MNESEVNIRRLRVMGALSKAQAAHVSGLQENARSFVDEILRDLRSTAEHDASSAALWSATGKLWSAVGELLGQLQVVAPAQMFWEGIHDGLALRLDQGDPLLLAVKSNLALAVKAQGHLTRARELEEEVLAALTLLSPPDYPRLLYAKSNLAATVFEQGDLDRARVLRVEILAVHTQLLPPDHPDLLMAKGDLAATEYSLGDLEQARELQEEVLATRTRLWAPDHPDLLTSKGNLALTVFDQGDLERARELENEILTARTSHVPAGTAVLLNAKAGLAAKKMAQGDLGLARKMQEEVLAAQADLLPPGHPDLLRAMGALAATAYTQRDLGPARDLQEEVLASRTRLLHPDHPEMLIAKANLAATEYSLGDLGRARELQEEVLATRTRLLHPGHLDLLKAKGNLALTAHSQGDLARARDLQEEVLAGRARLLRPNHPALLKAKGNLAGTLKCQGDLGRARDLLEEVLAAQKDLLPAEHPDLLETKGNLAETIRAQGDLDRARNLQEEVLARRACLLAPNHPDLLIAKENLAGTEYSQGNLELARELLGEVLAARMEALPSNHPELVRAKANLALTMSLGPARDLQEEALAAQTLLLPANHPDLLGTKVNLALTVMKLGHQSPTAELAESIFASSLAVTLHAQVCAPREMGAILQKEANRLAELRFISPASQSIPALFRGIETLRAIAVPSAQRRHFFREHPEHQDLQRKLGEVGSTLNALAAGPAGTEGMLEWQDRFRKATHRRDTLEKEVSQALEEAGIRIDPIGHDIVSARLDNAVLVSYFRYNHWELDQENRTIDNGPSLLAHILKPDGTLHQVELGAIRSLTEVIAAWRSTLEPFKTRSDGSLSREQLKHRAKEPSFGALVRERLLDPIIEALGGWDRLTSLERLIVIPDDIMHLIPFDALTVPDGMVMTPDGRVKDRRLFDVIPVQIERSLRRLLKEELPLAEGVGLLSVGGVHYDSKGSKKRAEGEEVPLPFLRGTRSEMEAISRTFAQHREGTLEVFTEAAATAETVKAAVQGKRIVHLATHGWFGLIPADAFGSRSMTEPVPGGRHSQLAREFAPLSLCGLAFAGAGEPTKKEDAYGRVTGEDLATWELEACELILLTACQTNVGRIRPGQGIQSLQTAAHAAGARTALASLWAVPDGPTERLTTAFCELAFDRETGVSCLEALHRAKQTLRGQGLPASAWAGWVLTGNPGPLGCPVSWDEN